MSVLPTYLAFFFPEFHALIDIRLLRLLRVFRILKLTEYLTEISVLGDALRASRRKILVFICVVLTIDVLMGTLLYVVEGPENGFDNIPVSIYWAITTMTTVGFGDIAPKTGSRPRDRELHDAAGLGHSRRADRHRDRRDDTSKVRSAREQVRFARDAAPMITSHRRTSAHTAENNCRRRRDGVSALRPTEYG